MAVARSRKKSVSVKATAPRSRAARTKKPLQKTAAAPPDPIETQSSRRDAVERSDDQPPAKGPELIERVSWAIERELNQIELIVGGHRLKPTQQTEAERRARTLASLARTLAVVTQLRAKNLQSVADDAADDAMPRDLDEFRETLARRLEQLFAERPEAADRQPDLD